MGNFRYCIDEIKYIVYKHICIFYIRIIVFFK